MDDRRTGFEWIPSKSEPRSIEGMLCRYDRLREDLQSYEKKLIRAYFRKYEHKRWVVEEAAKVDWSDRTKSRMINELRTIEDE